MLLLIAYLAGLGMTNHLTIGAAIPSVALVSILAARRMERRSTSLILLMPGLFLLGSTPYLYLPLRASLDPPLNWGDPRTLGDILGHMTLSSHADYFFSRDLEQVLSMLKGVAEFFTDGFGFAGSALALVGLVLMLRRDTLLSLVLVLPVLILTFFVLNFGSGSKMAEEQNAFYLPVTVPASIFMAYALFVLAGFAETLASNRRRFTVWSLAIFLIPLHSLVTHAERVDKSGDRSAVVFARSVYESMEKPAVLLTDHTTLAFTFLNRQIVDREWNDVVSLYLPLLEHEWYRRQAVRSHPALKLDVEHPPSNIADLVRENRPAYRFYTLQAFPKKTIPLEYLRPSGPVMEISLEPVTIDSQTISHHRSLLAPMEEKENSLENRFYRNNLIGMHVTTASILRDAGFPGEAYAEARHAVLLDPESSLPYLIMADALLDQGSVENAFRMYRDVLSREPGNHLAFLKLGMLYQRSGDFDQAVSMYRKAIELHPSSAPAHARLGHLLAARPETRSEALVHYRRALELGYPRDELGTPAGELDIEE